jgi:hypothetical protein
MSDWLDKAGVSFFGLFIYLAIDQMSTNGLKRPLMSRIGNTLTNTNSKAGKSKERKS